MCKASFGLAMAAGLAISWFFAVGVATAEPYKWCAQYGGSDEGGASNCGFVTIEPAPVRFPFERGPSFEESVLPKGLSQERLPGRQRQKG
jgi:hypothetical protein